MRLYPARWDGANQQAWYGYLKLGDSEGIGGTVTPKERSEWGPDYPRFLCISSGLYRLRTVVATALIRRKALRFSNLFAFRRARVEGKVRDGIPRIESNVTV